MGGKFKLILKLAISVLCSFLLSTGGSTPSISYAALRLASSILPQSYPAPQAAQERLTIREAEPKSGAMNSLVQFTGTGLMPRGAGTVSDIFQLVKVRFGSVAAPVIALTERVLITIIPDLPNGPVTVTVEKPGESAQFLFTVDSAQATRRPGPDDTKVSYLIGEILLIVKPGLSAQEIETLRRDYGFAFLQEFPHSGYLRGQLTEATSENTLKTLQRASSDPRVQQAILNALFAATQEGPNDPQLAEQLYLKSMNLPDGWQTFFRARAEGATIAILDTGIDLSMTPQEFFVLENAPRGLNFAPGERVTDAARVAQDEGGHGTAVASIAAAIGNNNYLGAGVAHAAKILPIKVLGALGGTLNSVTQGATAAYLLGADVMNFSLGCICPPEFEQEMRKFFASVIKTSEQNAFRVLDGLPTKRPVIVAASGNDKKNQIHVPAAISGIWAVGSVTLKPDGLAARSEFSNFGKELSFVAQGTDVKTALLGGKFGNPGSGTSYAAPQIAGLAALILGELLGEKSDLAPEQVLAIIQNCFIEDLGPPGWDEETGFGRMKIPSVNQLSTACTFGR